jgi:hypothetical protein
MQPQWVVTPGKQTNNGIAVQLIVGSSYYEMKITQNLCIDKLFCDPLSYKPKKGPRSWSHITSPPPSKKKTPRLCGMSRTFYPAAYLKGATLQKNTNTVSGLQLLEWEAKILKFRCVSGILV